MQFAPGDIVVVETATGQSFLQVTHMHVAYPEVVRVLDWSGDDRAGADRIARATTRFTAMIPLAAAIDSGRIRARKIGTAALPAASKRFPTFKMPILDKQDGIRSNVAYWWLWDGDGLRYTEKPDLDINLVPMREVLSADRFLQLLQQ